MPSTTLKTLYFPANRTRQRRPRRVSISLVDDAISGVAAGLSGRQVRHALGDPILEDLEERAASEHRTLSNLVSHLLLCAQDRVADGSEARQLGLFGGGHPTPGNGNGLGLTFRDSKTLPLHRWYPYVEGFSADYVARWIRQEKPSLVYDPFGGAGTTMVEASALGVESVYSEVNPLMRFIAETKVNAAAAARRSYAKTKRAFSSFIEAVQSPRFKADASRVDLRDYECAFPKRDFFEPEHIRELIWARELVNRLSCPGCIRDVLRLCLASIVVGCSNMTRRADLRRRRPDEYKTRVVDVAAIVSSKAAEVLADISQIPAGASGTRLLLVDSRRRIESDHGSVDFAITSPPYLNGTNYFRNTKLELWFLGFIQKENELAALRSLAVAAGINNVSNRNGETRQFEEVTAVVSRLEAQARDRRIPRLAELYFSDMFDVLANVASLLSAEGRFVLDIGDSKFYGVHVPTDELLSTVAREAGLRVTSSRLLARRHSHDRSPLKQVELVFQKTRSRKPKVDSTQRALKRSLKDFGDELPYRASPYSKRNWGHPLHSLCSYQGKLKPSIAHWLVRNFTTAGEFVVDPLGGVGTVAFEACLLGRDSHSNDLSPLASTIAGAKLNPPTLAVLERELPEIIADWRKVRVGSRDLSAADWGLNASVADYYHERTLREILRWRKWFLGQESLSACAEFVIANLLHILHGNRPYALSRRSHPITPFNPSGPAEYRSTVERLETRARRVAAAERPAEFARGMSTRMDFRELPEALRGRQADCVITSPPFLGMRFDRPNWLRMWFCGWGEADFHEQSLAYLERQQTTSLDVYHDFFAAVRSMLRTGGCLVLHLGGSRSHKMVETLEEIGRGYLQFLGKATEDVRNVERHGLKDKGLTTTHEFLLFRN